MGRKKLLVKPDKYVAFQPSLIHFSSDSSYYFWTNKALHNFELKQRCARSDGQIYGFISAATQNLSRMTREFWTATHTHTARVSDGI